MENTMTQTNSPLIASIPGSTSAFAMSTRGCVLGATSESIVRDRQGLAAKGHVALVAYVPGIPAWSPPLC